jgi:hypothetical protein
VYCWHSKPGIPSKFWTSPFEYRTVIVIAIVASAAGRIVIAGNDHNRVGPKQTRAGLVASKPRTNCLADFALADVHTAKTKVTI